MKNTEIQVVNLKYTDIILVKVDMSDSPNRSNKEKRSESIKDLIKSIIPTNRIIVIDSSTVDISIISP